MMALLKRARQRGAEAHTWQELTGMGLVAYVGEFIDRAGQP